MDAAKRLGTRAVGVLLAVLVGSFLAIAPWSAVAPASAATAFSQCNGIDDTPGLEVRCTAQVTNNIDLGTGIASSTVVATVCEGAAGTTPNGACTTTTTNSEELVGSVTQCNYAGNGGGGNIFCTVSITNVVVGAPNSLGVTTDQCERAGDGGGASPLLCDPVQTTTGATVTQCNDSVDGGGADGRVDCVVSGATTDIGVLINQCNNSVNGGGSTASCAVSFTNNVTAESSGGPGGSAGPGGSGGSGGPGGSEGATPSNPGLGDEGGSGELGTSLAFTGVDSTPALEAALVTLLAGGVLLFLARRRAGARSSV
jgi:hypothetical protein